MWKCKVDFKTSDGNSVSTAGSKLICDPRCTNQPTLDDDNHTIVWDCSFSLDDYDKSPSKDTWVGITLSQAQAVNGCELFQAKDYGADLVNLEYYSEERKEWIYLCSKTRSKKNCSNHESMNITSIPSEAGSGGDILNDFLAVFANIASISWIKELLYIAVQPALGDSLTKDNIHFLMPKDLQKMGDKNMVTILMMVRE